MQSFILRTPSLESVDIQRPLVFLKTCGIGIELEVTTTWDYICYTDITETPLDQNDYPRRDTTGYISAA